MATASGLAYTRIILDTYPHTLPYKPSLALMSAVSTTLRLL